MLYRFVKATKKSPTFAEILAFANAALKGKSPRWSRDPLCSDPRFTDLLRRMNLQP